MSLSRISRYRNGITVPSANEDYITRIAKAFAKFAEEKEISSMTEEKIISNLKAAIDDEFDHEAFLNNFNELIDTLDVNLTDMASYCNYNVSSISKVRLGKRNPGIRCT